MKKFLAIFTCAENSKNHEEWKKLSQETQRERMQAGMAANEQWKARFKNQIIYEGSPLDEMTKLIDREGIHDLPSKMGYFLVVQANSHEEAARIFLEHPHFAIFPGDGVEVLECAQRATNIDTFNS